MATTRKNMELKNKAASRADYFTKHYMDNGWINIKNFFTKKEVSLVRKKINHFLRLNYKKYKGRDINFIGDDNFVAITKYNISHFYAMAVYYLSQELKK